MKILLAEDTKDLNRAVSAILGHEGYEVTSVFDGEEAMEALKSDSFDGIVLDIMMPKRDGLSVLKEIRERHILTPVMLLTAKAEVDDRVAGLDAGADDYLPKPFAMKELLARVRSMTRRVNEYSGDDLVYGDTRLSVSDFALSATNTVRLSIKEFELMQALMMNRDIPLSTEILLERVWKNEAEAGEDTVWLYISYLRGKLKAIGSPVRIEGEKGGEFYLACE